VFSDSDFTKTSTKAVDERKTSPEPNNNDQGDTIASLATSASDDQSMSQEEEFDF